MNACIRISVQPICTHTPTHTHMYLIDAERFDACRTGHGTGAFQNANASARFESVEQRLICTLTNSSSFFPPRACFCTNLARRRGASASCPKTPAVSASRERSSWATARAVGVEETSREQKSVQFAHIAVNSPRLTPELAAVTVKQTPGTVWRRPANVRMPAVAPMAVLKNATYGGRSPSGVTPVVPTAGASILSRAAPSAQGLWKP
jgi:hypothetical protein